MSRASEPSPSGQAPTELPTELFTYDLPPELIAQAPAEPRDSSRLLVLDRASDVLVHATFREIGQWLRPGDLLVAKEASVDAGCLQPFAAELAGAV